MKRNTNTKQSSNHIESQRLNREDVDRILVQKANNPQNHPIGSWTTKITVRSGKIVERVYRTPKGDYISLYPDPILESLLFYSDAA